MDGAQESDITGASITTESVGLVVVELESLLFLREKGVCPLFFINERNRAR